MATRIVKSSYSLAEWRKAIDAGVTPAGDELTAKEEIVDGRIVELWQPQEPHPESGLSYAGPIPPEYDGEVGVKVKEGKKHVGVAYTLRAPCIVYEHNGESRRVVVCDKGVRTGPRRYETLALSR